MFKGVVTTYDSRITTSKNYKVFYEKDNTFDMMTAAEINILILNSTSGTLREMKNRESLLTSFSELQRVNTKKRKFSPDNYTAQVGWDNTDPELCVYNHTMFRVEIVKKFIQKFHPNDFETFKSEYDNSMKREWWKYRYCPAKGDTSAAGF